MTGLRIMLVVLHTLYSIVNSIVNSMVALNGSFLSTTKGKTPGHPEPTGLLSKQDAVSEVLIRGAGQGCDWSGVHILSLCGACGVTRIRNANWHRNRTAAEEPRLSRGGSVVKSLLSSIYRSNQNSTQ